MADIPSGRDSRASVSPKTCAVSGDCESRRNERVLGVEEYEDLDKASPSVRAAILGKRGEKTGNSEARGSEEGLEEEESGGEARVEGKDPSGNTERGGD